MQTHKHRDKQSKKEKKKERGNKPYILINGTNTRINHFLGALHSSLSAALWLKKKFFCNAEETNSTLYVLTKGLGRQEEKESELN